MPVLLFLLLIGCTPVIILGSHGQNGSSSERTNPASITIANPASLYCIQNSGRLEIRREVLGETGYCIFSDRSWCEEWSYFKGTCKPGERFDL